MKRKCRKMSNKTSKLKSCPFCGNTSKGEMKVSVRRQGNKGYRVICSKCGACGPYVAIKEWHDTKMIAQGQAIKLWNERCKE